MDTGPLDALLGVKPGVSDDDSRMASSVLPRAFTPVLTGIPRTLTLEDPDAYAVYVSVPFYPSGEYVAQIQTEYLKLFGEASFTQETPTKFTVTAEGNDQGVDFSAVILVEQYPDVIVAAGTVRIEGDPVPLSSSELADLEAGDWGSIWSAVATRLGKPEPVIASENSATP